MADAFDYPADDTHGRGAIALPQGDARRPAVAIFADIGGVGAHTEKWANRIAAELGYVALAADVYGEGKSPADFGEGMQWIQALRADPPKLVGRANAALTALREHPRCDGRLAAIGFCFGGTVALELARSGATGLDAVTSFHGGLSTTIPAAPGAIRAKILVCHGAEDPMVGPELPAFLAEMAAAHADCQTIAYTGAVHAFTNESADGSMNPAIKYHAPAAARSWRAMAAHFGEVFG